MRRAIQALGAAWAERREVRRRAGPAERSLTRARGEHARHAARCVLGAASLILGSRGVVEGFNSRLSGSDPCLENGFPIGDWCEARLEEQGRITAKACASGMGRKDQVPRSPLKLASTRV